MIRFIISGKITKLFFFQTSRIQRSPLKAALPKMQNKQDEMAASIGDFAPEEEALKTAGSNSE
jgi:hypothetical protein